MSEENTQATSTEPVVTEPSLDDVISEYSVQPAAPAATPSRPTVRVHIGRLDVRATVDNTPVAPTARRDPARDTSVSLGDYLAGRKVGS
jgi:hypothetical protein